MKLQLRVSLQTLTSLAIPKRAFASNTNTKLKPSNASNTKKTASKVPGTGADISKMPQPHPVLTPLARSTADQASVDLLPKIESIGSSEKYIYRIELDKELQKRLPKGIAEVSDHFGGNIFVLRRELVEKVRAAMTESDKVIIDGPSGSGKSVLLMQMYAAVRESIAADPRKLVLYVPNCHKWTTGYFPYYPEEAAANGSVLYKQPELALEILRLLLLGNGSKMPEGLASKIEEAKLDAYNRALPLYEQTLKELEGKEMILFLDGVNGLIEGDSLTGYMDREGRPLPLKALPLCSSFMNGFKGTVIGSLTHSNPALPTVEVNTAINIPTYSNEDLKRILQLYSQLGHCAPNKSDQFVAFKAFVSGGNGRKLYKSCEYDSIYYKQ